MFLQKIFASFKYKLAPTYEIYTDGSQKGPWGTWSFVVVEENRIVFENSGRCRNVNMNDMEFQAVIEALKMIPQDSNLYVYSDSRNVIDALRTQGSQAFISYVQHIQELAKDHRVSWTWIPSHRGNIFNEHCDQKCKAAYSILKSS